jgi:hypothetical protein
MEKRSTKRARTLRPARALRLRRRPGRRGSRGESGALRAVGHSRTLNPKPQTRAASIGRGQHAMGGPRWRRGLWGAQAFRDGWHGTARVWGRCTGVGGPGGVGAQGWCACRGGALRLQARQSPGRVEAWAARPRHALAKPLAPARWMLPCACNGGLGLRVMGHRALGRVAPPPRALAALGASPRQAPYQRHRGREQPGGPPQGSPPSTGRPSTGRLAHNCPHGPVVCKPP